jgi:putative chitinase
MIAASHLLRFNPHLSPGRASIYAPALDTALALGGIDQNPPCRLRHFMAQLAHESAGFSGLEEGFSYQPARLHEVFTGVQSIAQAEHLLAAGPQAVASYVYAHKLGNGDIASGDGYRFRGRGFVQITGRANYAKLAKQTGLDLLDEPDLLSDPVYAARAAALFWHNRHINLAADADNIEEITKLVNGGENGLADRKLRYKQACAIWPGQSPPGAGLGPAAGGTRHSVRRVGNILSFRCLMRDLGHFLLDMAAKHIFRRPLLAQRNLWRHRPLGALPF